MVHFFIRDNVEGWCFFAVKGTTTPPIMPTLFQMGIVFDERHQVGMIIDRIDRFGGNFCHRGQRPAARFKIIAPAFVCSVKFLVKICVPVSTSSKRK